MWQLVVECWMYVLNMLVIGVLSWVAFRRSEQLASSRERLIATEKFLAEIETEEGCLRRLCGDFPPSTGENKMANRIMSVIRRWRFECQK